MNYISKILGLGLFFSVATGIFAEELTKQEEVANENKQEEAREEAAKQKSNLEITSEIVRLKCLAQKEGKVRWPDLYPNNYKFGYFYLIQEKELEDGIVSITTHIELLQDQQPKLDNERIKHKVREQSKKLRDKLVEKNILTNGAGIVDAYTRCKPYFSKVICKTYLTKEQLNEFMSKQTESNQ